MAEQDRVRAYAVLFWVGNLGFATAMATAGFVAQSGFVLIFWIDAVTGCLFGGVVWRFVSERDRSAAGVEPRSGGYRQVLTHRPMVAFTFAVMIYYFVYLQQTRRSPSPYGILACRHTCTDSAWHSTAY